MMIVEDVGRDKLYHVILLYCGSMSTLSAFRPLKIVILPSMAILAHEVLIGALYAWSLVLSLPEGLMTVIR